MGFLASAIGAQFWCHTCLKNGLCDGVQGCPFCIHADVGVVLDHLPANVACDRHEGLLAGLALGELGYAGVPQIVKAHLQTRTFEGRTPR